MNAQAGRDQAKRNFEVYEHLINVPYLDWAATALFYSAMHYADAWLQDSGLGSPTSHSSRAQRLSRSSVPNSVLNAYHTLRDVSEIARYHNWSGQLDAQRISDLAANEYSTVNDHFAP